MNASSNSGSTESGLRSAACARLGGGRPELALGGEVGRAVLRVRGAHRLQRGPADREREHDDRERRHGGRGVGAPPAPLRRRLLAPLQPRAQRPAPGHPAGAQQRHGHRAGHEPRPVDQRVEREHEHHRRHRQQPDPLRVVGQPAVAPPQPGRARRRHDPRHRAEQRDAEPDEPEVGERLHAVAVGVPDRLRAAPVARARDLVGAGARAHQLRVLVDPERLLPVLRAHRGRRGQAVGRVGRRRDVRVGHLPPRLRDLAVDPARRGREADHDREHGEHEHAAHRQARQPARARLRRAPGGGEVHHQPGSQQDRAHQQEQRAEAVPGVDPRGQRHVVGRERVTRERPRDHRRRDHAPPSPAAARSAAAAARPRTRTPGRPAAPAARRASRRASAPRRAAPSAGQASALTAPWPERRAASHSSGGMPSTAISPTAFQ